MPKVFTILYWGILVGFQVKAQPLPDYRNASKSQVGEDIYLYETFFYGKTNGVILESGALDGYRYSTTYMFDKMLQWKSIHIEGALDNFEKLVQNRPDCINMNIALCEKNRTLHYLSHWGGAVSGIREFMEPSMLTWRYGNKDHYNETEIPCLTMESAMNKIGVNHVDIWILDVEGGELAVLHGVNFETFRADVILMETTSAAWQKTVVYLQGKNYTCFLAPNVAKRIRNHACVRNGFQPTSKSPDMWPPRSKLSPHTGSLIPRKSKLAAGVHQRPKPHNGRLTDMMGGVKRQPKAKSYPDQQGEIGERGGLV